MVLGLTPYIATYPFYVQKMDSPFFVQKMDSPFFVQKMDSTVLYLICNSMYNNEEGFFVSFSPASWILREGAAT